MPDINFNFSAEDLDGLKKLLEQIEKVSKKIQDNIAKTGKVTDDDATRQKKLAAEALKVENAIKRQEIAAANLERRQESINRKQAEQKGIIGGLEEEAKRLRSAYKSATDEISKGKAKKELENIKKKLDEAKGSTNTWGKALDSFQFKFNALGNIAANVLDKMIAGSKRFTAEAVRMAAEAQGISNAFFKIADDKYLNQLRDATRGAVSDMNLMKAAVQAYNFKIPLEQLVTFLEFAGDRALSTGEDFNYLVESIVKGLGRKSVLILDNLGLSVSEINQEVAKTGNFMTGAANVIEREMAKAGAITDTYASQIGRLNASYENLKVSIGNALLANSNIVKGYANFQEISDANLSTWKKLNIAFDKTPERLNAVKNSMSETDDEINNLINQIRDYKKEVLGIDPVVKTEEIKTIDSLSEEIANLTLEKKQVDITDKARIRTINDQINALQDQVNTLNTLTSNTEEYKDIVQDVIDLNIDLKQTYDNLYKSQIKKPFDPFANIDFNLPDDKALKDDMNQLSADYIEQQKKEADAKAEAERKKKEAIQESFALASNLSNSLAALTESNKQKELSAVGDNAAKRAEIEKKYAKKQQNIAISQAIINGALGATKTGANLGFPLAIPFIVAEAAMTAIEIATIKAQKFAKGGPIGGKLHSNGGTLIEAEKGEYVINRRSTSKHRQLIQGINEDNQIKILSSLKMDKSFKVQNDPYLKKLYELEKNKPIYGEDKEFYIKHEGTKTIKIMKN